MAHQTSDVFGLGVVGDILLYICIALGLWLGTCSYVVHGAPKPTQKGLEYQKARDDHAQHMQCGEDFDGDAYIDCLKRHGLL